MDTDYIAKQYRGIGFHLLSHENYSDEDSR